jgi:HK97 family phage major capsid protein
VPEGFYQHLIEAQLSYGGMMTCGATILDSTTGNPLPVPLDNDTYNTAYIQGENTQMTPGVDVAFGQMVLTAYMYTTRPILVSLQFLQDSAFDIDSWLPSRLQTRIMRRLNTDFTVGDGVGKPFGMLTQATLGAVGSTGETATLSYVDFINIQHSVDPAYRSNSKFMWNDKTLKALRLVTDNQNRPLWQPAISEAAPDTFGGSNYIINQDMPVPAANAKTILFGDFSAYMIRRVAGAIVMRLTERYADFLQVGYILGQRWDGNLADAGTHPVKYFQQSAT